MPHKLKLLIRKNEKLIKNSNSKNIIQVQNYKYCIKIILQLKTYCIHKNIKLKGSRKHVVK